jgi:Cysteine-rich CPXCG
MPDELLVTCPFCGQQLEIYVEPDVNGSFVQDCEVCCNPWRVQVSGRGDDRVVQHAQTDRNDDQLLPTAVVLTVLRRGKEPYR